MRRLTKLVHLGRNAIKQQGYVNPPIYQGSSILFPSYHDYMEAEYKNRSIYDLDNATHNADVSYGITGTPTTYGLASALAELEGGDVSFLTSSGLSAITTAILSFVKSGDHILVTDSCYGPTRRFCNKELKKLGIETTYFDPQLGTEIDALIQDNTKIIFCETPGSLTFELQDIPAISATVSDRDIIIMVDNSWATPLNYQPFDKGADISIQAITKYINGHADVLLGAIITKEKHADRIFRCYKDYGISPNPHHCYLAQRGLRTLAVRLNQHEATALKLAGFLTQHPKVSSILHPGLPTHPQHELFLRDFSGSSGLFSIILDKTYHDAQLGNALDTMQYFGIGASWGGYESLILPFNPASIRTATSWNDHRSCIRIHAGLEDSDDLLEDLKAALERL